MTMFTIGPSHPKNNGSSGHGHRSASESSASAVEEGDIAKLAMRGGDRNHEKSIYGTRRWRRCTWFFVLVVAFTRLIVFLATVARSLLAAILGLLRRHAMSPIGSIHMQPKHLPIKTSQPRKFRTLTPQLGFSLFLSAFLGTPFILEHGSSRLV
ncbi:hypothetical protein BDZ97DRAFT_234999 [Flammula alnicola]|nr:hypothetical protein BDZ97DRAFT_234999 [Flammula alnicola]